MASYKDKMLTWKVRKRLPNGKYEEVDTHYLEVKWRVLAFRDAYPQGEIWTEVVREGEDWVLFRAEARTGEGGVGVGHRYCSQAMWKAYYEKAETGAIGRALSALGFGTEAEFEEGDDLSEIGSIADSPHQEKPAPKSAKPPKDAKSSKGVNQPKWLAVYMEDGYEPLALEPGKVDDNTVATLSRVMMTTEATQLAAISYDVRSRGEGWVDDGKLMTALYNRLIFFVSHAEHEAALKETWRAARYLGIADDQMKQAHTERRQVIEKEVPF